MRVKSPRRQKHRQVLKLTKGYRMTKNRLFSVAHPAMLHAGQYAFAGRRLRRRDLRSLWIVRVNAILRASGISYSRFIASLKQNRIRLDRKILAELAVKHPQTFSRLLKVAGFTFTSVKGGQTG